MSIQLEVPSEVEAAPLPVLEQTVPEQTVPGRNAQLDRLLPVFRVESTRARWIWLVIAALVVWAYGAQTLRYWAPADGGVDQNAYLLGGRMIAEHFSTRYTLPNPYAYVGGMMIRTSKIDVPLGDYYPKYPLGLPLLYACFFWIFGATRAATLAFLVSPISSIMAVAGMFFLGRLVAGSFSGLMAAILLGTSELMIELSNNPNSHASCLAFIVWGMYFLLKWWQTEPGFKCFFLGILGGFLIGYAGLIRYSEGLLVLAIAVATFSRLPWNTIKTYRSISVPIAFLAAVCLVVTQVQATGPGDPWTLLHKALNVSMIIALAAIAIVATLYCVIIQKDSKDWKIYALAVIPGLAMAAVLLLAVSQVAAAYPGLVTSEPHWTARHNVLNVLGVCLLMGFAGAALIFCLIKNEWQDWRLYFRSALPGLAWAVPIAVMLIYNKHSMGNWTGYDSTNESEGFTWLKFKETWEQMLRTYYDTAAFFVLPLGLAGIVMVFGRSWKLGLMLLAWLLPGSALYASYYWSPDRGISYARFFLVFLPAIMLGVAICFSDGILAPVRNARWHLKIPRIAAVLLVVGIAGGLGVYRSVHGLQQGLGGGGFGGGGGARSQTLAEQQHVRQNLALMGQELLKHVPANSVLFAESGAGQGGGGNERPLNYIQFIRHWDTYSSDAFDQNRRRAGGGAALQALANNFGLGAQPADPTAIPTPRQPLQTAYEDLISGKRLPELRAEMANVINSALKDHRGVFALAQVSDDHDDRDIRIKFNLVGKYNISVVETWSELPPLPPDPVTENAGNTGRTRGGGAFGGGGGALGGGGGGAGGGRRGNGGFGGGGGGGGRRGNGGTSTTDAPAAKWELLEIKPL